METEKKHKVKSIFDDISGKYDLLNHLLSFGVDKRWRKKALKLTGLNKDSFLLDVACGTGDVAIEAKKLGVEKIVGADFSHNMLSLFNQKSKWIVGNNVQMVAEQMPFRDNIFTNITVAFGVRNFYNIQEGFNSFYRVLKPGGKATIIEFRMPKNKFFAALYKFYFKKILPAIGGLISGNRKAYTYLPESVEEFDMKVDLIKLLQNSGFRKIDVYTFTFGIVQTLIAEK
ncbi:MAG: bifunctional demethylmenaquinone methyltransferase/2-methoxy-6-polyprenyl-1,4-benzoquinol methylase UbiE [Ignavibacterium album]|jgi:demethylmenaquinone methyltransferase/2-methoxy-6-polyprenyl-1,4-benzoquinol methylase|uniref:bifunctional demethylmenaquinone methyltransferase/2-methoxy-6-polyprenyl-1,4-benzoquinol methylase UbiE n=1 Tax=Ignavibacterium album TaxID=591197 RepID=UPI0026ED8193|nr:bifunctional demethylmenaquinone methyltransferase/2-methoxy-6-polyprenyl-1,4-benzoquinol methylase UbiE [Ignavibacterium album]MCX8105881.1 bifunctional demethylmenaquinone methyltransferase/2-methoxy-6-polyprenyl-1,4-benzoquinol methylase UbiE [Ignavibacterium album]